ncbi:Oidioi.mRNA.OKI2018_I69.YSR.g17123.t1.cds [Oikopleura dioica]|uniref:Oidioi.mRNA.OKI2018_I69.YSR.g17123.t1.cds n=1 Tax=Oikopleura dioica TaxID=34765 RepID=A0ABN7SQH5_OIKDI|nr:Oidioi.mRNA.OKI2018_I69.YSR.g17123.t1.cds [Oikopleura dioica]
MMMTNNPKRQWEIIHNNIEIILKGSQYDSLFHVSDYIINTFHQVIWGPRLRISIRFRYRGKHSAHPEPNYTILPILELKWSQKLKMFMDAAILKTKDDRKKRKLIKTMRDRNRHMTPKSIEINDFTPGVEHVMLVRIKKNRLNLTSSIFNNIFY